YSQYENLETGNYKVLTSFWKLSKELWLFWFCSWIAIWILFEIISQYRKRKSLQSLLLHFRFGPLASFLLFIPILFVNDFILIQYSKIQITQYVFSNADPQQKPNLILHNDYRGFCGNAYDEHNYWLYGEVAAKGFENPDPKV